MKLVVTQQWLASKLARCDNACIGAGGTSIEQLAQEVARRVVTPAVLADVPTELGKVVRYVRENHGWTRGDMAELADIDEAEVIKIETLKDFDPTPRTVSRLADVCHFSPSKFRELAGHAKQRQSMGEAELRFAARSKRVDAVDANEFDAIRALVAALSED